MEVALGETAQMDPDICEIPKKEKDKYQVLSIKLESVKNVKQIIAMPLLHTH